MTHGTRAPGVVLVLQAALAAALPWLLAALAAPVAPLWAVLTLLGITAFCWRHRRAPGVWALAGSSALAVAVGLLPAAGAALALSATVAVVALGWALSSLRAHPDDADTRSSALLVTGWSLVSLGLATAAVALLATRLEDGAFDAAQSAQALAFTESAATAAPDGPAPTETTETASAAAVAPPIVGEFDPSAPPEPAPSVQPPLARLEFRRPGTDTRPVTDRVLYVGPDVTAAGLAAGPGHYPSSALPGRAGNAAIAGHRTGWGSPFRHLDQLRDGDEVVITDRRGREHVYAVMAGLVVDPTEAWVLGPDPLGTGRPTLTLTTCDPPHTDDRRLVVFAQLVEAGSA